MGKTSAKKQKVVTPVKATAVKLDEDSDEDTSDEEELQLKPWQKNAVKASPVNQQAGKNQAVLQKKGVKRPLEDDDEDDEDSTSDDSSDEVEETPVQKKAAAAKTLVKTSTTSSGITAKKPAFAHKQILSKQADDDDDDSSDESSSEDSSNNNLKVPVKNSGPPVKLPAQKSAQKKLQKEDSDDDDDDDDDDSSEEDEEDSDEEDDSDDEEVNVLAINTKSKSQDKNGHAVKMLAKDQQKKAGNKMNDKPPLNKIQMLTKQQQGKKEPLAKRRKIEADEDSDDDDDEEEEDDDEEEEEDDDEEEEDDDDEDDAVRPQGKTAKSQESGKKQLVTQKRKLEDSDDDDDDDDEEEDEEEDEEDDDTEEEGTDEKEETIKSASQIKTKKEKSKKEVVAKKQKLSAVSGGGAEPISLFVANLDQNTTEEDVSKFFKKNSIDVAEVRKPPKKRNAFVDLKDPDDLEDALALNGSTFKNNPLRIERAKPRSKKETPQKEQSKTSVSSPGERAGKGENEKDSRTLFVKNLPENVTVESLQAIFDSAVEIRVPKKDGSVRGFGFIEFPDKKAMEKAMTDNQGAELNGNSLFLDYMGSRSSHKKGGPGGKPGNQSRRGGGFSGDDRRKSNSGTRGESKVLFVKNLSYDTDESSLKTVFKGAVSARIPTFPDSGKSKGFAFVDFKTPEAAAKALDSMTGKSIDGRQILLDFAADRSSSGGGGGGRGGSNPRGRGGGGRG